MSSNPKQAHWQRHIDTWRQSGLSQKTYCQQHKLSYTQFCYWRTRINQQPAGASRKLIPVSVAPLSSRITVLLPAGIRLEVPVDAMAQVLPVVVHAVTEHP